MEDRFAGKMEAKASHSLPAKSITLLFHAGKHGKYPFVCLVQVIKRGLVNVTALETEFQPRLGLCCLLTGIGKFIDKNSLVSSLSPGFR